MNCVGREPNPDRLLETSHQRSQTLPLSQVADLIPAFLQITDFEKAQSQVTERLLASPPPPHSLFPLSKHHGKIFSWSVPVTVLKKN